MQLHSEYLPATGVPRHNIVLLHGWGSNREVWRPLLFLLRPWANITLLDLPGCAPDSGQPLSLADLLAAILDSSPEQAVYMGWSLGGQLAIELAAARPERVVALVTLCSNPLFLARDDWPGMDANVFHEFANAFRADPVAVLKRFHALQAVGSRSPRRLLRQFQPPTRAPASAELLAGLAWLETLDLRAALPQLTQPQLHLLAEEDALVPDGVSPFIASKIADKPLSLVKVLPQTCHLAPLDIPEILAQEIEGFLKEMDVVTTCSTVAGEVEKKAVAASFSRAATGYDSVARLQRDVGQNLLGYLDAWSGEPQRVLDLGCGTGHFCPALRQRYPAAQYLGLDLAGGMVDFARRRGAADCKWLVADAESLPLASGSIDLVFSSLAVQWCFRLEHLFAELSRVLTPGGLCVLTSLGPATLCELRSAWSTVDSHQHVNTFLPAADLVAAAKRAPGVELTLQSHTYQMDYQRVRDLLDELKALGAHNMTRNRPPGLTSRRALQGMLRAYETRRVNGVLPATYDVIFGVLKKR